MAAALFIRSVDPWTAQVFKNNAGARGLKHGEYLTSLILLHQGAKERARDNTVIAELLEEFELAEILA